MFYTWSAEVLGNHAAQGDSLLGLQVLAQPLLASEVSTSSQSHFSSQMLRQSGAWEVHGLP